MVAQLCEYTENHWTVHFNWMIVWYMNYISLKLFLKRLALDFPGGAVVKNLLANAGDTGSSPGPGRSHMPRSN